MGIREVVREDTGAGIECNDAKLMEEFDREDPHFQRIARLGALDEDWSRERMCARTP